MDGKLQDFIAGTTGKVVGDTPQNKGQCVGLVEVWLDTFGLPHIWGNAKDLLTNADKNAYDVIYNTPTNVPAPGSIICWDSSWGEGDGHTALVLKADVNSFTVLEQNNPIGSPVRQGTHAYQGVQGWIYPKVFAQTFNQVVVDTSLQDAVTACQTQLKSATESNAKLQEQITSDEDVIRTLRTEKENIQKELDQVKLKRNESDSSVIALKNEIAEIHKQDADYLSDSLKANEIADERLKHLKKIMDAAGIQYDPLKEEEIMHEIAKSVVANRDNTTTDTFAQEIATFMKSWNVDEALKTLNLSPLDLQNLQDPGEQAKVKKPAV
jgi:surface antigen